MSVDILIDDFQENIGFQLFFITLEKFKKKCLLTRQSISYLSRLSGTAIFSIYLVLSIKKVKRIKLLFTIFFLLATVKGIVAQQLHTYIDTDSVSVGDRITYTIVFNGTYNSITYPDESQFEPEFEWINRERYQLSERRDSLVYHLQFFGTDDLTITRKAVHISSDVGDTTLYTVEIPLRFKSVLDEGDADFRPFKPIFDFARNWFLVILLIIFIAIFLYFLFKWYQNREKPNDEIIDPFTPPDPFINPLDQLNQELSDLSNTSVLSTFDDYERFYVRLGDAIRSYLKCVYSIKALEMTTREILDALHRDIASPDIIAMSRKVLNEADMVKFANFQPTDDQVKSALKKGLSFAETAAIVDNEKIRYMKYKYEELHGIRNIDSIKIKVE